MDIAYIQFQNRVRSLTVPGVKSESCYSAHVCQGMVASRDHCIASFRNAVNAFIPFVYPGIRDNDVATTTNNIPRSPVTVQPGKEGKKEE